MDIVIRKAEKSDLAGILSLYGQLETDNCEVLDINAAESIYDKMGKYPDYSIYVAELDGKLAGTFALAVMDNIGHMGAPSGLVEDVAVASDLQRNGIGKRMMEEAIRICKAKGCYKVMLSSNMKREGAHRFYESIGFKKHGYSFYTEVSDC
ncbi:MAG TPA: GNAT family N-acetyltransferase [Clostridia bacterium]|nr:GNAT family N-acetyltransferase [Clostridia bacterium]